MEEYSKDCKAFKQDKKLRFLPQLGSVDLTLELKDRTLDFTVSPIEAAVIELFSSNGMYSSCRFTNIVSFSNLNTFQNGGVYRILVKS